MPEWNEKEICIEEDVFEAAGSLLGLERDMQDWIDALLYGPRTPWPFS